MFAYCIIEYPVKTLDKAFTYQIPSDLRNKLKVGMKVLVPFNNRTVHGIVLKITNNYEGDLELKEITSIEDEFLVLNKELLLLGRHLQYLTMCSLITAYQTMLPSALKVKTKLRDYNDYEVLIKLNKPLEEIKEYIKTHRKSNKTQILTELIKKETLNKKELNYASLRELKQQNIIVEEKIIKKNITEKKIKNDSKTLNDEQKSAYQTIIASLNKTKTFLLYGVTGSGKTLIYINLIKEVIKNKKTALLLVPEISLSLIHI